MELKESTLYIIEGLLFLVVLSGIIFGILFFAGEGSLLGQGADAERKTQLGRLQASAATYHSRLRYFDGVCSDIGVPDNFVCNDTEDAYAVSISLTKGGFYCADSTGFRGETTYPIENSVRCAR